MAIKRTTWAGRRPPKPKSRRKDTKRWCRGVVGREHKFRWKLLFGWWSRQVCESCGKHGPLERF